MDRTVCTKPQWLYSTAIPLLPPWIVRPVHNLSACTIQLYLYSPYGPYSLYRASVPVQGCTLPLPLPYLALRTKYLPQHLIFSINDLTNLLVRIQLGASIPVYYSVSDNLTASAIESRNSACFCLCTIKIGRAVFQYCIDI